MTFYRGGSWNLEVNRDKDLVLRQVQSLLEEKDLDFLSTQESWQYDGVLSKVRGWEYLTGSTDEASRDSGLLVRNGIEHAGVQVRSFGDIEWEKRPGVSGLHWPRKAVYTRIKVEGKPDFRVWSIHLPPRPLFPLRGKATDVMLTRLVALGDRHERWVMPGDWNGLPDDPMLKRARQLAGAEVGGQWIDQVVYKGVKVKNVRKVKHGTSNHRPLVYGLEV